MHIRYAKMGLLGTSFQGSNAIKRRFLILVNPASGKGKALKIAKENLLPILTEAEIEHELVETQRQNHALEIVREMNIEEFDGVVIVSGDGLFHEAVNGLLQRQDAATAVEKVFLFPVPAGSGNALAASLVYSSTGISNDDDLLTDALVLLATGKPSKSTICRVRQVGKDDLFSFLLQMWGMMADIDFDSEKYRKPFGGQRFLVSALKHIATLESYKGSISVVKENETNWTVIEGPFVNAIATNVSHFSFDSLLRKSRNLAEKDHHGRPLLTMMIYKSTSKINTTKLLLSISDLDEIDKISEIEGVEMMRVSKVIFDPEPTQEARFLDVDGERVPYSKMEVEVMPLSINVLAGENFYDFD